MYTHLCITNNNPVTPQFIEEAI